MNNNKKQTLQCVAIDDEPFALDIIQAYCKQTPSVKLKCFTSSIQGYKYIEENTPDILFLDIVMPDMSGIEIAQLIKKIPYIIFTTAHSQYALESYDYNTVDYLLKPYSFDRFYKALSKARDLLTTDNNTDETITIRVDYQKTIIKISEITHIESIGNYVKIYCKEKSYMPQINMKNITQLLQNKGFIRVHKSFVVSTAAINSFNKVTISIGKHKIPIGRTYATDTYAALSQE